jgi:nucleotide-binding universal stress UspA family protein
MPTVDNALSLKLDQIVLATDFTGASEAATDYARAVAERFSSTTSILHVIDLSIATRSEASMAGWPLYEMREDCAANMAQTREEFSRRNLRFCTRTLESFSPGKAIVDFAEHGNADLLIIGTRSRSRLNKMIEGSCADGVIHHSRCPVITLGPKAKILQDQRLSLKSILLATDLEHDAAGKASMTFAMARELGSKVYVCHVVGKGGKISENMRREAAEAALRGLFPHSNFEPSPVWMIESGNAGERILELARGASADMIVLGARAGGSYSLHWTRGVVNRVLAEAECPVMTIRSA